MQYTRGKMSVFLLTALLLSCTTREEGTLVVGHKNFTEQRLIGKMLGIYLGKTLDRKVEVRETGSTMITSTALLQGEIDLYVEYTGTYYSAILGKKGIQREDETYRIVKDSIEEDLGLTLLPSLGFNNTYKLIVRGEDNNLQTISDLSSLAPSLLLGSDIEFGAREDGYSGFVQAYGFEFKELNTMDPGLTYGALVQGKVDVAVGFGTDGRIAKFNLHSLEDDKDFFPPYDAVPTMSLTLYEEDKELVEALSSLAGAWSDRDMQGYNLRIDEGESVQKVAEAMLMDKGLLP